MGIVYAIVGLGALILVHELGHMLVARWHGMRVDKFSIGFGPPLVRWRGKSTTYQIALIPLGGFVQIAGMNPHEQLAADDPGSYANKPLHARFLAILVGPLTNYLFAVVIVLAVTLGWGLPQTVPAVAEVAPGSPAEQAGLLARDQLLSIAGQPVHRPDEVPAAVQLSKGRPIEVRVQRQGRELSLRVQPRDEKGVFRIGIVPGTKVTFLPMRAVGALMYTVEYPIEKTREILGGLGKLFTRQASVKDLGGPLEVIRQLKMSFEEGLGMALLFLALLNVYLGIFNLLPLPALDGGRLIFLLYAMVTRRPVNERVENAIHTVGFILLLGLILLITYRDAGRIFGGR